MIKDIIKTFEEKFNNFAGKAEAIGFRFISDEDSAIGTICYADFEVEFEYCLDCGILAEKSALNIILDFSKRRGSELRCMVYDMIPLIDRENFNCWFYCCIENKERMALCCDKLISDFSEILPKIADFVKKGDFSELETQLGKNILNTIGITIDEDFADNLNEEHINPVEEYDYLYEQYFAYQHSVFASNEYKDFLEGNYKKALKSYEKKKERLVYEELLIEHMKSAENPQPVLSEEYRCLRDGLKNYYGVSSFFPFMATLLVPLPFFTVLCIPVYYAVAYILHKDAIYSSSLEWFMIIVGIIPAIFCSLGAGYFVQGKVLKIFFKSKRKKLEEYDTIFNSGKEKRRLKRVSYLSYLLALVVIFILAHDCFSMYDSGFCTTKGVLGISSSFYSYSDTMCIDYKQDEYCVIKLKNGETIDIGSEYDEEQLENKILPIFEDNGVQINELR